MKHLYFLLIVLFAGCSHRPTEMPPTFPCSITIVNAGTPLADYNVGLYAIDGNGALSIMASPLKVVIVS